MGDAERAKLSFEHALRMNPSSISALLNLASVLQDSSQYMQAAELYHRAVSIMETHHASAMPNSISKGEVWAALGFSALMLDDLPKAYSAYQQALLNLGTVLDPMIWYGIGILYDRYGSDDHALEAFGLAIKLLMKKPNPGAYPSRLVRDIYYRIGVLLRCRNRPEVAIACFEFVASDPPVSLSTSDISLQIALAQATLPESVQVARDTLLSLITSAESSGNQKLLLQAQCHLAWLNANYENAHEAALPILTQIAKEDSSNPLPWYYTGRIFSLIKQPVKAYEAFQQAVYRDGRNAAYWNSVGILYMESQQYRDALDAFSRAIQLAPFKAELWWNLGVLYESCNSQFSDAVDAYQRAYELDSGNENVFNRLSHIQSVLSSSPQLADDSVGDVFPVEMDPLLFLPRPTLLNGQSLPPQNPLSQLPPPPVIPRAIHHQQASTSVMPRIPNVNFNK